jgi:hypothetical protein
VRKFVNVFIAVQRFVFGDRFNSDRQKNDMIRYWGGELPVEVQNLDELELLERFMNDTDYMDICAMVDGVFHIDTEFLNEYEHKHGTNKCGGVIQLNIDTDGLVKVRSVHYQGQILDRVELSARMCLDLMWGIHCYVTAASHLCGSHYNTSFKTATLSSSFLPYIEYTADLHGRLCGAQRTH